MKHYPKNPHQRPIPAELPREERKHWPCLPFDKVSNFRDLGGIKTDSGLFVRWGMLYRSAHLYETTKEDRKYMERLSIRRVTDFRGHSETKKRPDQIPETAEKNHLPIDSDSTGIQQKMHDVLQGRLHLDMGALMVEVNHDLVTTFTSTYRHWIKDSLLNENSYPQLFHCTAGKDRTGFGAAIVLKILGVSDEDIFQDYMESNKHLHSLMNKMIFMVRMSTFFKAKKKEIMPLFQVHESYLQGAMEAVVGQWGNFNNYIYAEDGLDLNEEQVDKLKAILLEE